MATGFRHPRRTPWHALALIVDTRSPQQRRRIMQSVGQKNTGPELAVRRIAHDLGFRFRLHRRDIVGRPDMVFPRLRKAILVNGCFWHGHRGCRKGRLPKSRLGYWRPKIERNRERDGEVLRLLRATGWDPLTIWQCEIADPKKLRHKLEKFLVSRIKTIDSVR